MNDPDGDTVHGQTCPRCRRETVVYNGNYYCSVCTWVMGEAGRPARIVKAYLKQRQQLAIATDDKREQDRIGGYLAKYQERVNDPVNHSDIRIVARSVVARVLTGAKDEVVEMWENYPLVGERDWDRVVQEVEKIRDDTDVSAKVFAEAYDRLGLRGD